MGAARQELVERHLHIPAHVARRYARPPRFEYEDLEQIAREELVRAARDWGGQGMFSLYASVRCRRAVVDEYRRELGRSGARSRDNVSIDVWVSQQTSTSDDYAIEACLLLSQIRELPPRQRFTITARACELTQAEIGLQLGVSESRVSQIEARARATLAS